MPDDDETLPFDDPPASKSQRKREMEALRDLGRRLLTVPEDMLSKLTDPALIAAVRAAKKITRGSARKRQIQYIGKLLRSDIVNQVQGIIDRLDASSRSHTTQFHQLEIWREQLIADDPVAMTELTTAYPGLDRQHLRQLVRNAITERTEDRPSPVHYRKLFQYLRHLFDDTTDTD
jgi:ribosome-associated protein